MNSIILALNIGNPNFNRLNTESFMFFAKKQLHPLNAFVVLYPFYTTAIDREPDYYPSLYYNEGLVFIPLSAVDKVYRTNY